MRKITKICKGRAMEAKIKEADHAIEDAIDMALETVEAIIAEIRLKDSTVEWRSACDEIMDRVREEWI